MWCGLRHSRPDQSSVPRTRYRNSWCPPRWSDNGDDGAGERGVERIGELGLLGPGQEDPSRGRSRNGTIGSRTSRRSDSIRSAPDQRRMQRHRDETRVFPPARGQLPTLIGLHRRRPSLQDRRSGRRTDDDSPLAETTRRRQHTRRKAVYDGMGVWCSSAQHVMSPRCASPGCREQSMLVWVQRPSHGVWIKGRPAGSLVPKVRPAP